MNLYDYCGSGKVLVVDDDAAIRDLVSNRLGVLGYTMGSARDGQMALDRLEEFRPKVVVLDIDMPGMDGLEVLRRIGRDRLATLPVVMLTGKLSTSAEVQEAMRLGAKDFLTKPFSETGLARRISRLMKMVADPRPRAA